MSDFASEARAQSLEAAVKLALRRMQTDGLAHQLEMHRTSSQFVARRLTEVLKEFIEVGREKEIQKLLHEIDSAVFERDKSEMRLQRARTDHEAACRSVKVEHQQLTQARDILASKIAEIKQKQAQNAAHFEKAIVAREREIRSSNVALAKTKALLNSLTADLSELKADLSINLTAGTRLVKSTFRKAKDDSKRRIRERNVASKRNIEKQVNAKKQELDELTTRTSSVKNSVANLTTFLNGLAKSQPDTHTHIRTVLSTIVNEQETEAVEHHLSEGSLPRELATNPSEFAQAAKKLVEEKLKEKITELDRIIAQARQRRLKLQAELDTALAQIRSLQGSRIYDDSDFQSNMSPQFDFEGTTRQLDATLSQLGKELGKRR